MKDHLDRAKRALSSWWDGEVKPFDGDFFGVYIDRHWTSEWAHEILHFYRRHWQWVWSTAVAVTLAYAWGS